MPTYCFSGKRLPRARAGRLYIEDTRGLRRVSALLPAGGEEGAVQSDEGGAIDDANRAAVAAGVSRWQAPPLSLVKWTRYDQVVPRSVKRQQCTIYLGIIAPLSLTGVRSYGRAPGKVNMSLWLRQFELFKTRSSD